MVKVNQMNKNPAMAICTFVHNCDKLRYFVVPLQLLVLHLVFTPSLVMSLEYVLANQGMGKGYVRSPWQGWRLGMRPFSVE